MVHIKAKKLLVKILILALVSIAIFFTNKGLTGALLDQIQNLIFIGIFAVGLFVKSLRKQIFILTGLFYIAMIIAYLLEKDVASLNEWTIWFGSTGFGMTVLLLILYLPDLVRDGYLKDFLGKDTK